MRQIHALRDGILRMGSKTFHNQDNLQYGSREITLVYTGSVMHPQHPYWSQVLVPVPLWPSIVETEFQVTSADWLHHTDILFGNYVSVTSTQHANKS